MPKVSIECTVNGEPQSFEVYPMARLLDVLRHHLALTGVKEGCGEGECGACSVLMNADLVNSCLVPALQAHGTAIRTIEGIDHPVQRAFVRYGGAQCGICTPGMIVAAVNLLERNPHPTLDEIRFALAGNLCRCTGYVRIVESIFEASRA